MSLQVQSGSVGFEFNSGLPLWRRTKSLYVVSYCSIPSVDHWGFTALWSRYLNGWFEHQGYFATPPNSITCCGCGFEIKMVKMKGSTGSKSGQKIYCILLRQLHWADFQARWAHAAHRAAKVGHYLPWSTSPCHFCRCCSQGSENPRAPWSSPCTQTAHTAPTDHEVLLQAGFSVKVDRAGTVLACFYFVCHQICSPVVQNAGETLPGSTKRTTLNDLWVFNPHTAWCPSAIHFRRRTQQIVLFLSFEVQRSADSLTLPSLSLFWAKSMACSL